METAASVTHKNPKSTPPHRIARAKFDFQTTSNDDIITPFRYNRVDYLFYRPHSSGITHDDNKLILLGNARRVSHSAVIIA